MRKTLFALTAIAGLIGLGAAPASAAALRETVTVQTIQYYGGYGPRAAEWREREWHRREWERHHHWEMEHRWHGEHRGW